MTAIWHQSFGDENEYIDFFFNRRLPLCDALVSEENGEVVSQLFLMPGNMRISGKIYPSQYIYAAATLPEFRNRGHMAQLIESAKKSAMRSSIDFLALVPGEAGLYNYYSRFGFSKVFTYRKAELSRKLLRSKSALRSVISSPFFQEPSLLWSNLPGDRFIWDNGAVQYAIDSHKLADGDAIFTDGAWSLPVQEGSAVFVSELCANELSFPSMGRKLLSYYDAERFIFRVPEDSFLSGEKSTVYAGGMLCPLNKSAQDGLKVVRSAYIGLALE